MKITMAVKMELFGKWHILGRRGSREKRDRGGEGEERERRGVVGEALAQREREGESAPRLQGTGKTKTETERHEKNCTGKERRFGLGEEWGKRITADPEEA